MRVVRTICASVRQKSHSTNEREKYWKLMMTSMIT